MYKNTEEMEPQTPPVLKKKISDQQSTVALFLKTHRMFKKVLDDIDCLEEYFSSKLSVDWKTGGIRGGIINDTSSNPSVSEKTEAQAKKILAKIP